MRYVTAFPLAFILLLGCQDTSSISISRGNGAQPLCDDINQYCINFAEVMNNRQWTDNWTDMFTGTTDHTVTNGVDMDSPLFTRADLYSSFVFTPETDKECPPAAIGISNPIHSQELNGVWGEVDEKYDGSFPAPNCRIKSVYPHKNPYEHMTAFAFCSEKDSKKVLICLFQGTKDPVLAEQIFSTFRWME